MNEETVPQRQNSNRRINLPSRTLIKFYPHKLKTFEQYFRGNEPPKDIEQEKEKLFVIANLFYQYEHYSEDRKKWKVYEHVANRKEKESEKQTEKEINDVIMIDCEEIPVARPYTERHGTILNGTISDNDTNISSSSSDNPNRGHRLRELTSDTDDDDEKRKRKLRDTSLSPTNRDQTTATTTIRKKKEKNKKKKKATIENDPRAPDGSPTLTLNRNRVQSGQTETRRPDTPSSPTSKRPRLFAHTFKPPRNPPPSATTPPPPPTLPIPSSPPTLPRTPPGLSLPPVVSPRQSTPRTPITTPQPLSDMDEHQQQQQQHQQEEHQQEEQTIIAIIRETTVTNRTEEEERAVPMEQDSIQLHSPSAIPKDDNTSRFNLFNFPIIPIECKYHFRAFRVDATYEAISAHCEFLEQKAKRIEEELEQLLAQFSKDKHRTVIEYTKKSIDPIIETVKRSNQQRLDNLLLDQMNEQARRVIKEKATRENIEQINLAQQRFERTQHLKFQLDKLDRRLNENMPPPALNILDKLQFRSRELTDATKEQYSEQWNSIIRKTKLEITSIMRAAKTAEIEKSEKEHQALVEKIPNDLRKAYRDVIHTVEIRHNQKNEKKLSFLVRKAQRIVEK
jgi:hypothetical protein